MAEGLNKARKNRTHVEFGSFAQSTTQLRETFESRHRCLFLDGGFALVFFLELAEEGGVLCDSRIYCPVLLSRALDWASCPMPRPCKMSRPCRPDEGVPYDLEEELRPQSKDKQASHSQRGKVRQADKILLKNNNRKPSMCSTNRKTSRYR